MATQPPADARILLLLNPGRQSRHYLLGLAAGADRAGIPCLRLELGPIWERSAGPDAGALRAAVRARLAALVRRHRITHAVGYIFNGTHDLGFAPGDPPTTIWDELGVRHLLLWTDHPEWAVKGAAIDPPLRTQLGGPLRSHFLKSRSAAEEAAATLRWPNLRDIPMAEDDQAHSPVAAAAPVHDVVAIVGDAAPPHPAAAPFLELADPDPAEIDAVLRPYAERAWRRAVGANDDALLAAWLDAKLAGPLDSFWRLSRSLESTHQPALTRLRADPRLYYSAIAALRCMVGWRRNFWLAWLGRRVDLGLYGSPAAGMGFAQPPGAEAWVPYAGQGAIYARGRFAININAPHDEEGLTHKPFQVAASGTPCIHHAVRGLDDCFQPGREVLTFRTGPELLELVRTAPPDARAIGAAMRARAARDHTWQTRIVEMLRAAAFGHEPAAGPPPSTHTAPGGGDTAHAPLTPAA